MDGWNAAAVDLFDLEHARKVLIALGRAHGRLPADPDRAGVRASRVRRSGARGPLPGWAGRLRPARPVGGTASVQALGSGDP